MTGRRERSVDAMTTTLSPAPTIVRHRLPALLLALATPGGSLLAQTPRDSAAKAPAAAPAGAALSGVLFANYQYHAEPGASAANRFDLDRAYLTVRAPLGDRLGARVTADIFKAASGYDYRIKYAYLQYDWLRGDRWNAFARLGVLNTVVIEHEEGFWPRWLGQVGPDRNRFFSSADLGASTEIQLPSSLGAIYATVTNGPGYANIVADDRFKDYAVRLTLTPFAARHELGLLRTLAVSPWYSRGDTASVFAGDAAAPVGEGVRRDRWGVHAGIRDPRLTLAAHWAVRADEREQGLNTPASPRTVSTTEGELLSAYAVARPFAGRRSSAIAPLGFVARVDRFRPDRDADGDVRYVVGGVLWDLSSKVSVAADYQEQLAHDGAAASPSQVWYFHVVAAF